jgi:DNA-binding NtrC family response regulator
VRLLFFGAPGQKWNYRYQQPRESPGAPILLVENDACLRSLAQQILCSVGYQVLVAEDGVAALCVSEQHDGPIQLLVTEAGLPGMSNAASPLRALRPEMGVLVMLEDAGEAISHQDRSGPRLNFLPKPWTPEGLCEKIRAVLTSHSAVRRILVVDDDLVMCKYLAEILGRAGHQVSTLHDSRKARAQIKHLAVDVVITDLLMPDVEGMELICAIRREQPQVKIIAISGAFGPDMLRGAELLGANATLTKPISARTILRCVQNIS